MADATLDLATVWDQIRERLAASLSPQQNAMLNLTRPLGLVEDTAVLAAPNEFTQTVLESRIRTALNDTALSPYASGKQKNLEGFVFPATYEFRPA